MAVLPILTLDADQHVPALGELDRISDEIYQHLPDAARVADEPARRPRRVTKDEFEALLLHAHAEHFADFLHRHEQIERHGLDRKLARFDLRKIEDVIDDPEQRIRTAAGDRRELALPRRQLRIEQESHCADHAIHRSANLMAHRGEEVALGTVGRFGGFLGVAQSLLETLALGNVVRDDDHADDGAVGVEIRRLRRQ